ncbi:MAG: glycoside hydrolase family 18 protein [Chloroflexota bacterium]
MLNLTMRSLRLIVRFTLAIFILASFFTSGCSTSTSNVPITTNPVRTPQPVLTPSASKTPAENHEPFRIIGYVTESVIVETIPFENLTHINYAFLVPNGDGTFAPLTNAWKIKKLISRGHQLGVKILISVGGWGREKEFEAAAANKGSRTQFVNQALILINDFGFDGIDIDWEYPVKGNSSANYLALMQELRAALPGKLLTTAVVSYGDETGSGVPSEIFDLVDFVNVMTYDGPDHASMLQFQKGLDYWLSRGAPKDKLVLGIPFYSRPGEISYKKLLEFDPNASNQDRILVYGKEEIYNGVRTVKEKTRLAKEKASGVMFWTLEQDTSGENSLLLAIHDAAADK